MNNSSFDLIIIGGGAAGIMAALSAKKHHTNYNIAILDRTFVLGRKILVCGAGRCNITNINLDKKVKEKYYGAAPEFIESIFKQFEYKDIVSFFNDLGIELYVERKTNIGKLFPITDQAKTVTALLEDELERLNINVILNTDVFRINKNKDMFFIEANELDNEQKVKNGISFSCNNLILSAGGKTYPALGSNGSGYILAQSLNHTIITPVPSALPLISKNNLSHALQGTKMEIEVTSIIDNIDIKTTSDDVMFTQYGLSGPAILNISREISIHFNRLNKNNVKVRLNFFPGKTKNEIKNFFEIRWSKRPSQSLEKSLYGIFPNKIPMVLLNIIGINKDTLVKNLSLLNKELLIDNLASFIVNIEGTRGWNEAEFTAGGVDTTELKFNTLESKIISNLYFCGEILDVDGDVGGYNLSWAWSSGYVAGKLNKFNP